MADGTGLSNSNNRSEALEALLHGHMDRLRAGRAAIAVKQEELRVIKKAVQRDRNAASQDFRLKVLDAALVAEETNDRDTEEEAAERMFVFSCLGLPTGLTRQGELQFGEPANDERDEEYWAGRGYNAGLKLQAPRPPDSIPPQFIQVWMMQHAAGTERTKWAAASEVNVEHAPPPDDEG